MLSRFSEARVAFDVIVVGEPLWRSVPSRLRLLPLTRNAAIFTIAAKVASSGARVGMASVVDDDRASRARIGEMTKLGIDVDSVAFTKRGMDVVVVDAAGGQSIIGESSSRQELELLPSWSANVVLLTGLLPITSKMAALCRIARRARREGAVVVLDLAAGLREWMGRDPRTIAMILKLADVVRCSLVDLAVLGTDIATVRETMLPTATLIVLDAEGASALGAFGEVRVARRSEVISLERISETCCATICSELARPLEIATSQGARWQSMLDRWVIAASATT